MLYGSHFGFSVLLLPQRKSDGFTLAKAEAHAHRLLVPSFVWYRLLHPGREGLRAFSCAICSARIEHKLESVRRLPATNCEEEVRARQRTR
jgi:hypothetical protein